MTFYNRPLGLHYKFPTTMLPYTYNLGRVTDPYIDKIRAQIWSWDNMANPTKQNQLSKDGIVHELSQAYQIQLPTPYIYTFWQPWVKNYHGEYATGYNVYYLFTSWISYDQDVKKQMTGRR